MFKITKEYEKLEVQNLNILIYGEPGIGKTSVACTSSKPILLDFDKGAHRSAFRKDVLQIENWSDFDGANLNEFIKALKNYDTVIIDTIDKLLDAIGEFLLNKDPRYANKLKLQFYGELGNTFTAFCKRLRAANKDLIFLAHVSEDKDGDLTIKRPLITGKKGKDFVYQNCDLIGFYYKGNKLRLLDFNPNDTFFGKNCVNTDIIEVPNLQDNLNYFKDFIEICKYRLNAENDAQKNKVAKLAKYKLKVSEANKLTELNEILSDIKAPENSTIKNEIWTLLEKKSKELNFVFDKTSKLFKEAQNEN